MNRYDPRLAEEFLKYNQAYVHKQNDDVLILMQKSTGVGLAVGEAAPEDIPDCCVSLGMDSDVLYRKLMASGSWKESLAFRVAYWLKDKPEPYPLQGAVIHQLSEEDIPFLLEHYIEPSVNETYIRNAIERGMLGVFEDEHLAGFIGSHDEGSMGMLMILPEYRGKHYAEALETEMIRYLMDRGHFVYCQIETDNDASVHLQNKLGMTWDERIMYWVFK